MPRFRFSRFHVFLLTSAVLISAVVVGAGLLDGRAFERYALAQLVLYIALAGVMWRVSINEQRAASQLQERMHAVQQANEQLLVEIAERSEAETAAERQRRKAETLAELARVINPSLDLDRTLPCIVEGARELCGSDVAAIALRDPGAQTMTFRSWDGSRYQGLDSIHIEPGKGVGGHVLVTGDPFRTDHYAKDPRISEDYMEVIREDELVALLAVPIWIRDAVEGVLYAANRSHRPFTDQDEAMLQQLADHAAIAIGNARLYRHIHQINAQLTESEAKYRGLLESASDAIVINQDRRYVYFNRAWVDLVGYTPEEIPAKDFVEFYAPAFRGLLEERYARRLQGDPPPTRFELQLQHKAGKLIDVEVHISVIVYQGKPARQLIVRDITERKRAEAEIRTLAQALKSIAEGVAITDMRGHVVFLNRETERITGYRLEDLQGQSISTVHSPNNLPEVRQALRQATRLGGWQGEFLIRTKGGEDVPVYVITSLVRDAAAQPIAIISIGRDITEQKHLQEQLIRAERLQAVGQMAGGVAHDFNNLLTVILGRAQLLHMHPEEREAVTRGLHIIEQAALDGAEVVRHLQQFTGVRRERTLTLVDLSAIVSDAMDMTKPRWKDEFQAQGNPIAVATNLIPGCLVEGDPAELREMLINLILNALDAMPQGGALQINTAPTAQHVRLTVADTGIGMHPEAQRRAFEPFFTTKGPQSSGLGLSISYGIVQRHGGTIALQSQVGRGTAFTMTFPRTHKRGTDGAPGEIAEAGARGRVLVIDDEPHVAQMLAEVLATAGHAAEIALTGKDGLERLGAGRFDVVFTDLGMPGMNGYEVTRQSKAACPTLPVVLMTGWGIQLDDQQVKAHGVDRLLTKPFNLTHVLRLVQELLPVQ